MDERIEVSRVICWCLFVFLVGYFRGFSTVVYGLFFVWLLTFAGVVGHGSVTQPAATPSPEINEEEINFPRWHQADRAD